MIIRFVESGHGVPCLDVWELNVSHTVLILGHSSGDTDNDDDDDDDQETGDDH